MPTPSFFPQGPVPGADEDEQQVLNRIDLMKQEATQYRSPWDVLWRQCWNYYLGRHWGPRPKQKAVPVENYVFSKTQSMMGVLTANRPRFSMLPRRPEFAEYAEVMNTLGSFWWDRTRADRVRNAACLNALLYSKGLWYVYWDYDADDVACESVDPQCIYIDPHAVDVQSARYLIHVTEMSVGDVMARWPDSAQKFALGARTVEDQTLDKSPNPDGTIPYDIGMAYADAAITPGTTVPFYPSGIYRELSDDEMVQVLQVWIADPSVMLDIPEDAPNNILSIKTGRRLQLERQTVPGGRLVIIAGNRVIHDGPNPYSHGWKPYVAQSCHDIPGEFWGISLVQNLISPQKELNKVLGHILDEMNHNGFGDWVVDKNCGVTPEMVFGNRPGKFLEKVRGSEVRREPAPPIPAYITGLIEHFRRAMDDISGIYDVTQGRKPAGLTAGIAITALQEAANVRQQPLIQNMEEAIAGVATQWLALAQQFYTEERYVRATDRQTGEFKFVRVDPEIIRGQWEIVVAAGSTMPRSREARQAQALELYKYKLFDAEETLNWIEHPGRDRLIQRLNQRHEQEYDMAMQGVDVERAMQGQKGLLK